MSVDTLTKSTNPLGMRDGPTDLDNYKRAVHRPPPARFTIAMLPPTKQGKFTSGPRFSQSNAILGGSVCFGMRICAVTAGDRSSRSSGSSSGSMLEYEIWRRWEDCLWFQDVLETDYETMARQKKQRLKAGKGVRTKDGLYNKDFASSWESLPPGPDPKSVAQDLHAYIPKLTKKGTLFRASQATIDQRNAELTAFVQALFMDDAPTLLKELRDERSVTDFFGYWRRDYDLAKKQGKIPKERVSLSAFFSGSSVAGTSINDSSSTRSSARRTPQRTSPSRARKHSSSSDSSSPSRSSIGSMSTIPGIVEEVPLVFEHNQLASGRGLDILPENHQFLAKPRAIEGRKSISDHRNRSVHIFGDRDYTADPNRNRAVRESWQTTASASTYLEGLNMTLPPDLAHLQRARMSVSSIATFMSDSSADAIIPRSEPTTPRVNLRRSLSTGTRHRLSVESVSESDGWSDGDDAVPDTAFYDSFPMPSFHVPGYTGQDDDSPESRPETPLGHFGMADDIYVEDVSPISSAPASPSPETPATPRFDMTSTRMPFRPRGLSVTITTPMGPNFLVEPPTPSTLNSALFSLSAASETTCASTTTSASTTGQITLKAAHNKSIILLRVARDSDFFEVRARIHDKLVSQENVPLSDNFTLAVMVNNTANKSPPIELTVWFRRSDATGRQSG
ncbi:hypothetical protein C8J56DRAFT_1023772 [Mycena floridula]|nr:hypothetical protein C8J56DRAFT_1023772 [Mycena floridula]